MSKKTWQINGFLFATEESYNEAKKEQEAFDYIKENTNLNNIKIANIVYHKFIAEESFHTVIGIVFMKELRDFILEKSEGNEIELPPIGINGIKMEKEKGNVLLQAKQVITFERLKRKIIQCNVIICFLVLIIIGMFIISYNSKYSNEEKARETIINEYSSWKEELEEREEELKRREEE